MAAGEVQDRQGQGGGRGDRAARRGPLVRARRRRQHVSVGQRAGVGADLAPGAVVGHHRRLAVRPEPEDGDRGAVHRRRQERHARRAGTPAPRSLWGASRRDARDLRHQGDWGKLLERFARAAAA